MANGIDNGGAMEHIGLYLLIKVRGDGIRDDFKMYPIKKALEHLNELIALKYDDELEIQIARRRHP